MKKVITLIVNGLFLLTVNGMYAPEGSGDDIYMTVLPSNGYARRISEIISNGIQRDKNYSASGNLIELLQSAYENDDMESFDKSLLERVQNARAAELPLLVTFIRSLQAVASEKLFVNDPSPKVLDEFDALQRDCYDRMQARLMDLRTDVKSVEELYEHFDKEEVSRLLLKEYPDAQLNNELVGNKEFKAALRTAFSPNLEDFATDYYQERIEEIVASDRSEKSIEENLQKVLEVLLKLPSLSEGRELPLRFDDPVLNTLVEVARLSRSLANGLRVSSNTFTTIEDGLRSNRIFSKYPKLWFRAAGILIDSASTNDRVDTVENTLEKTILASGKRSSIGRKIVSWFKDHCSFRRLRLRVIAPVIYKDNDRRYYDANLLLDAFFKDQKVGNSIDASTISRGAKESIMQDVAIILQGAFVDKTARVKQISFLQKIYAIDPEGKIFYDILLPRLNKDLKKEMISIFSKIQSGVTWSQKVDEDGFGLAVENNNQDQEDPVDELLDDPVAQKKGPVESQPRPSILPVRPFSPRPDPSRPSLSDEERRRLEEGGARLSTINEDGERGVEDGSNPERRA